MVEELQGTQIDFWFNGKEQVGILGVGVFGYIKEKFGYWDFRGLCLVFLVSLLKADPFSPTR